MGRAKDVFIPESGTLMSHHQSFSLVRPRVDGEGGDSGRVAIRGSVETVEMLGHDRIVYLRPSESMILNTEGTGPAPSGVGLLAARLTEGPAQERGTPLTLTAPAAEIHWFDETGNAIVA